MPLGVHDSNPPPVNAIAANAAEGNAVNVFVGRDGIERSPFVDVAWHRVLQQYAVDRRVRRQRSQHVDQFFGGCTHRESDRPRRHSDGDRPFGLHLYIRLRRPGPLPR